MALVARRVAAGAVALACGAVLLLGGCGDDDDGGGGTTSTTEGPIATFVPVTPSSVAPPTTEP